MSVPARGLGAPGAQAAEGFRRPALRVHDGHTPRSCPRGVRSLLVDRLMRQGIGLAVAGRRAASGASAMIAWVLARAGWDPSALLTHPAPQLGGWGRLGTGPHCVFGVPDHGGELGPPSPRLAVLLDVDVTDSLRRFMATVHPDGAILALGPNEALEGAVAGLGPGPAAEWLSLERRCSWWGADLREDRGRFRFRAFRRGRFVAEVRLQVPGRRHVVSALAAVAACHRLGVPGREIREALGEFSGLSRDFESRGSYRGVTLVDDAGRDAAAVADALALCRQVFGPRRLCAVLGAGGGGAPPDDLGRYVPALAAADYTLITGEDADGGPVGPLLADALVAAGGRARWLARRDDVIADLDRYLQPGDVLVTLGAGAVGTIADAFIRRLPRDRQGR